MQVETMQGHHAASVPPGQGNTVVSARPGRIRRIIVTSPGTGPGSVLVYDSADADDPSGTIIAAIPATVGVGPVEFECPAHRGIVVQNVAGGPGLTVVYS